MTVRKGIHARKTTLKIGVNREMDKPTNKDIAHAIRELKGHYEKDLTLTEIAIGKAALAIMAKKNAKAEQRLQRAIASHYNKATMSFSLKAVAERKDPLSLEVEMTLLPLDKPNANNQLVPQSEKDNILTTALFKPIRASFDGKGVKGHVGNNDIGVITSVYNAGDIIYAVGSIWTERNTDIESYLLSKSDHGGSFEIYYGRSEQHNGIEYLYDTVFAAQALVANPAYGSDTPIRIKA